MITDEKTVEHSLIVKCVNAIAGKQEISHQQVLSYIVGGGDYYTSHVFQNLKWADFRDMIRNFESGEQAGNGNITLCVNNGLCLCQISHKIIATDLTLIPSITCHCGTS